jgi:monoamine oxidase
MKVCIVGSGISGLYAAHLLKKSGADVTIFEKNKTIGGRIKNVTFDGIRVVAGAGIGREKVDVLLRNLCEELDVKLKFYEAKPVYIGIKPDFSPIEKIKELKVFLKEEDRRRTFKEFYIKYLGVKEYKKFVSYVGETDFEKGDVVDVIYDYGFENSFSSGLKAFSINWDHFLNAFKELLKENIVLEKTVKRIQKIEDKFVVDGEIFDKVILATPIATTIELLRSILHPSILSLYNNIACQTFVRLYVKLDQPLNLHNSRTAITKFPLQKIIEMDRDRCIYMISYSDNNAADFWKNNKKQMNDIVEQQIMNLFGKKNARSVLKSKLVFWDCGTHYFKPLDPRCESRDEFLDVVQHPLENLYVVGEAFSRNQGWCEGALESVNAIFNI